MGMSAPDANAIRACLPASVDRLVVAYSGGVDSTVLLHLAAESGLPVVAVHVHHGLQSAADDWVAHCQWFCDQRQIPLTIKKVDVKNTGNGLEAAAREARYSTLAEAMTPGACLLTGHHADDQAETLLLRMLRGTGPDGMTGIEACRSFGEGWLARPLLPFTRFQIEALANDAGLRWVEDPSNAHCSQDRNYLRQTIMPALRQRWPQATNTLGRLADLAGEQRVVLNALLQEQLRESCADDMGPMSLQRLVAMTPPMQAAALRAWIAAAGLRPPSQRRLRAGLLALLSAKNDRTPKLEWSQGQVARHGDWLYRLPRELPTVPAAQPWTLSATTTLDWQGVLGWIPTGSDEFAVPEPLHGAVLNVRPPQVGERLALAGRPQKMIMDCARESGILPWWRSKLPVVETPEHGVLAVAGLGLTRAGVAQLQGGDWRLVWSVAADTTNCDLRYIHQPPRPGD